MKFDKRLSRLEAVTPDKTFPSLGEYLKRERTIGTTENKDLLNLYNESRYEHSE